MPLTRVSTTTWFCHHRGTLPSSSPPSGLLRGKGVEFCTRYGLVRASIRSFLPLCVGTTSSPTSLRPRSSSVSVYVALLSTEIPRICLHPDINYDFICLSSLVRPRLFLSPRSSQRLSLLCFLIAPRCIDLQRPVENGLCKFAS